MGGPVPISYYLSSKEIDNDKTCITLAHGGKEQFEFPVDSPNTMTLRYLYLTYNTCALA